MHAATPSESESEASVRQGNLAQSLLLLLGSCLPVLGAVLLAPLLPLIHSEFAQTPGVEILTPLTIAAPALTIALISPLAGMLADRYGRKRLLVLILPVYALAGTAPIFLDSLPLIVASRFALGAAEAVIMTICTTLIGDYFHGAQRERMLALQTVFTSVSAVVFVIVGGVLGAQGWRTAFWLYAVGFAFCPLAALLLWEPVSRGDGNAAAARTPMPWARLAPLIVLTLLMAVGFYVVPSQGAFLLRAVGVSDPALAGAVNGGAQAAVFAGALSFRLFRRAFGFGVINAAGFVLSGAGLVGLGLAQSLPQIVGAAVVNGFGLGVLLPGLLSWIVGALGLSQRGRGAGAFTAAFFLGQFASPLIVLAASGPAGGLSAAILAVGVATLIGAPLTLALGRKT